MEVAIERQTMKKVYLRLLPFCFVLYFICYLDRVNIGFAALTMNKDIGLSAYVFGLGAGAFFWGYFLLEVPSNLILEKVGARRWIGRIMISWGLVSGAFVFTQGPISFILLRFSLGLAEGIAFSPDGRYLYVGNFVDGNMDILRLDGDTLTKVANFALPGHPASMRGSTP